MPEDYSTELNDFIIEKVGGLKRAQKFGLDHLSYEMLFYDEEICLIQDLCYENQ